MLILKEILETEIEGALVHTILRVPYPDEFFVLLSGKKGFHSNYKFELK
jgi:hypothetical protein